MCTVLLPPGGYPIAVNKYIISFISIDNTRLKISDINVLRRSDTPLQSVRSLNVTNCFQATHDSSHTTGRTGHFNPYPTAFPYGNGMVLHFYQQQESSTTKTVHKVINRGLKTYV